MPQTVTSYQINNGFQLRYFCPTCFEYILQDWQWNSFCSLTSNFNTVTNYCPICHAPITSDISSISRPFYNCAFNIKNPLMYFAPNHVSGLSLWLDASNPNLVELSGDFVSKWIDKSPYCLDFDSYEGDLSYIDGYLLFNGTQKLINNSLSAFNFIHEDSFTLFFTIKFTSYASSIMICGNRPGFNTKGFSFGINSKNLYTYFYNGSGGAQIFGYPPPGNQLIYDNDNHVITMNYNDNVSIGSTCSHAFLDGVDSLNNVKAGNTIDGNATNGLCIGAMFPTYNVAKLRGRLYEIIFFNRLLDATDRSKIENYLMLKHSI